MRSLFSGFGRGALVLAISSLGAGPGCHDADSVKKILEELGKGHHGGGQCKPHEKRKHPRATQGSAVVLSDDGKYAVATNRTAGRVSVFSLALGSPTPATKVADIDVGKDAEPWAAVFGADDSTAFVILRKTQRVVRIKDVRGTPFLDSNWVGTGSEPTGLARTPSGSHLLVANSAEGTVTKVNTSGWKAEETVDLNPALSASGLLGPDAPARPALARPRALVVTDDGDCDDGDESVWVTEFFSQARTDALPADDSQFDVGRQGVVYSFGLGDKHKGKHKHPQDAVTLTLLAPTDDTGFVDSKGGKTGCFPNQLYAAAINDGRVYVTGVCSSPKGPIGGDAMFVPPGTAVSNFKTQVHAAVYVIDTSSGQELTGQRVLLPKVFTDFFDSQGTPDTGARRIPLIPNDIGFVPGSNEALISGYGSDAVFRVVYNDDGSLKEVGSPGQGFFNLLAPGGGVATGTLPIGVAATRENGKPFALVLNANSRNLSVLDIDAGSVAAAVAATDPPSTPEEIAANRGARFFVTGTGRWSLNAQSWNSCESCHPDGLSDNVTWFFARGPRNTTSMDATYDPHNPSQRRLLNWTAIQEEVHDFELNTRDNSGGVGAIVWALSMPPVINDRIIFQAGVMPIGTQLVTATPQNNLNGSVISMMPGGPTQPNTLLEDWNEIDTFFRVGIRSPRAPISLDPADVEAGRKLFETDNCAGCHAGTNFTQSKVFYTPGETNNNPMTGLLRSVMYTLPAIFPAALNPPAQATGSATLRAPAALGAGNDQIQCAVRSVGTFPAMGTGGIVPYGVTVKEVRSDMVTLAQGATGFNIPSLLNMVTGAPYFHAGNARTLEEALGDVFATHRTSLSAGFTPSQTELRQLVAFLLSIDETTYPVSSPLSEKFDLCTRIPPGSIQ